MKLQGITFQNSGSFSPLIVDYLHQKNEVKNLYHLYPNIENFKKQIEEKKNHFPIENREILYRAVQLQNKEIDLSDATRENIEKLKNLNTFTVTTGHQLNLFTGPLYFLYKIISTINLAKQLQETYPDSCFVPIYWMATEDHDFDEIKYFQTETQKIESKRKVSGPVGRLKNEDFEELLQQFSAYLGLGKNAQQLKDWFEKAYLNQGNLATATRFLANELFKEYGLVIVDGDDPLLKKLFVPYAKRELEQQVVNRKVKETFDVLKNYKIQVQPRDINLFYIEDGIRERIVLEEGNYRILNTDKLFSKEELFQLMENSPEKISPNAIMRPLYQEIILPNLCYIGGGGELAYWLELKQMFQEFQMVFPMLLLRNSVLLITQKQYEKMLKLKVEISDLFAKKDVIIEKLTKQYSTNTFDFNQQIAFLHVQFEMLKKIAQKTDASFIGAVAAQEQKQINGLKFLEKRLLKAEKKKCQQEWQRVIDLKNELFPNGNLQERVWNFSVFYKEYGNKLIEQLFTHLEPLTNEFDIIVLE